MNKALPFAIILAMGTSTLLVIWHLTTVNNNSSLITLKTPTETSKPQNQIQDINQTCNIAIQADLHLDEQSDPEIYRQTLQQIKNNGNEILIDLGDTFMIDKLAIKDEESIINRYELVKSYLDELDNMPIYFVSGNHDGETGWDTLYTKNYRQKYFPDSTFNKNYYSFERCNALFIVLDPYTYTTSKADKDGWIWTLGEEQYNWLKSTLENSKHQLKFVFIHHLLGGDQQGRGGIEWADKYEWGGNNADNSYGFNIQRQGWEKPIHELLVDNGVDIVFKGHDHFYAKQELDGIIYQTMPQPSHPSENLNSQTVKEYGYINGIILGGSGYLQMQFSEQQTTVNFIKYDGTIAQSYSIQ